MIKPMDMENIFILMEQLTQDNGKMINNMVKERKFGQMVQNMKEIILKVESMVGVNFYFMMVQYIKVNSNTIIFMDLVYIYGLMEMFMMDNGYKIK